MKGIVAVFLLSVISAFVVNSQEIFHNGCVDIGTGNISTGEKYCRICITVYNNGGITYNMLCGREIGGEGPVMALTCAPGNSYIAGISPQEGFQFDVTETEVSYDFTLAPNDEMSSMWNTFDNLAVTFDREIVDHLVGRIQSSRNGFIFWSISGGPWRSIVLGTDGRSAVVQWLQLCSALRG